MGTNSKTKGLRCLASIAVVSLLVSIGNASEPKGEPEDGGIPPVSMNGVPPEGESPEWIERYWHNRFRARFGHHVRWEATAFFEDNQVVTLCDAISIADCDAIAQMVDEGVNINAFGKHNMTPLYWAFHVKDDLRPFLMLLHNGADPNVATSQGDDWKCLGLSGNSVALLVSQGTYNRCFREVFSHGGDPNSPSKSPLFPGWTPLHCLTWRAPDAVDRLTLLIERKADLNRKDDEGLTSAVRLAQSQSAIGYRMVHLQLSSGLDWDLEYEHHGRAWRLIHFLAYDAGLVERKDDSFRKAFHGTVAWLEAQGESLEAAKQDLISWGELRR